MLTNVSSSPNLLDHPAPNAHSFGHFAPMDCAPSKSRAPSGSGNTARVQVRRSVRVRRAVRVQQRCEPSLHRTARPRPARPFTAPHVPGPHVPGRTARPRPARPWPHRASQARTTQLTSHPRDPPPPFTSPADTRAAGAPAEMRNGGPPKGPPASEPQHSARPQSPAPPAELPRTTHRPPNHRHAACSCPVHDDSLRAARRTLRVPGLPQCGGIGPRTRHTTADARISTGGRARDCAERTRTCHCSRAIAERTGSPIHPSIRVPTRANVRVPIRAPRLPALDAAGPSAERPRRISARAR